MEFFGSIVLGLMIALSNAGGIGGGGIIVPIAIIFFRFRTKQAVAISNFCIFTASVVRYALNFNKKHPKKDAKIIDYSITMIMLPMVLLGSLFGVQINMIIPESILLGALTIILIYLSITSLRTSLKIRKKENLEKVKDDIPEEQRSESRTQHPNNELEEDKKSEEEKKNIQSEDLLNNDGDVCSIYENPIPPIPNSVKETSHESSKEKEGVPKVKKGTLLKSDNSSEEEKEIVSDEDSKDSKEKEESDVHPELAKIIWKEQSHIKPSTLILFPFLFITLIVLILIRGTSSVDSIVGIESCSAGSFVVLAILILFYVVMTGFNTILVKNEYRIKVEQGYNFVEGDLKWETKLLVQFILCAFGAGFIAGTVGLGGGVIFNPLLLSFKVPPQVASATGMFMITFGSLSNVFLFTMADYFHFGFGFWLGAYTALGTTVGIISVNKLIKKTGRTSYIAFILTLVIILSAIIIPIYGILQLIQDSNDGKNLLEFGSF